MPATQRGQAYRLGPNRWGCATTTQRPPPCLPFPSKSAALATSAT